MFGRRSFLSRMRDAAVTLTVPPVVASIGSRNAAAQDHNEEAAFQQDFQAMPFDNPPFAEPPLTFGERSGITVVVRTDNELVRSLVPAPLKPAGSELMIQQHLNTIIKPIRVKYPNATVIVPVTMDQTDGFYMARVYEGSALATMLTIWGREVFGFPKIAADTNVVREGNRVNSYVRAGKATASVELQLLETTSIDPEATLNLYCRKTIPSVDNQGPDLDRIIEVPWRQTAEHRVSGDVEFFDVRLDVGGQAVKLPVEEHVAAFWFTQEAGTILDKGKIVHDYLT